MIGLGTIVNGAAIVAGGLTGLACRRLLKARYQETITKAMGFAVMVMALATVFSQMLAVGPDGKLEVQGTMRMIFSLAGGALAGEWINLDLRFEQFGRWLRDKSGNQGDGQFINGFVTATLTVSIGAMAILGAIQDGVSGSHDTLYAKAILDLVIVMMMTAAMGKGCIFSAIPVVALQGSVTLLAWAAGPVLTQGAIDSLSLVGNVLIFCVGVNLVWPKTIRVANILPAVILAVIFAMI